MQERPCLKSQSLVRNFLGGDQPESKELVIDQQYSRFTKPAYANENDGSTCNCSGKCATVRCSCRLVTKYCTPDCKCKIDKCENK